jgi:hypothetical protein
MVTQIRLVNRRHQEICLSISEKERKRNPMNIKQTLEELKQLPPATQIAVILFALVLLVLLAVIPTLGTSIIAFLVALKTLTTR